MPSYQTIKNSIKKLESKKLEDDQREYCGVINQEDFEKLEPSSSPAEGNNRHIGYLLAPRRLSEDEWNAKHCT